MNLIICVTPLQMLIANKIIDSLASEEFYPLILAPSKNKKYDYYSNMLILKCGRGEIVYTSPSLNRLLYIYYAIKFRVWDGGHEKIEKIFMASINELLIQLLLSGIENISSIEIFTFDDGTINITQNSCFYTGVPEYGRLSRIINKVFRNKYSINKIKELSRLHYSIYKNRENIIDNTEYIDVFNLTDNHYEPSFKVISLFLGQPMEELFDDRESMIKLVNSFIHMYEIDYYFPHPREKTTFKNITYIDSELIFEDFFIQNLNNKHVTIYTFFSGAVLSLVNLTNVKIVALKPNSLRTDFLSVYDTIKEFGVEVREI